MNRVVLHLDMNSYFASVEQQANPFLRGKPVGVCATMTKNGCIIASSKEAKAVGIKTGCRVQDALFLYPNVALVPVDPPKYRSTTQKIFSIIAEYTEDVEHYSIDEAFLNLTGFVETLAEAKEKAMEIQRRVKEEVGDWLTCSMGIAPTRWLAKFGSDTAPKGGIVVLNRQNLLAYLKGRELTEAWGIAHGLERRLHVLGIWTLDELAQYPVANLMRVFGIRGYEMWANVNGIEFSRVEERRIPKSIGHSHVLRRRVRDIQFHRAVFMRLCERTGRRLRNMGLEAGGVFVQVGSDMGGDGGDKKLAETITGSDEIFHHTWQMIERTVSIVVPTFFAVGVFRLQPISQQQRLWRKPKRLHVYKALDEINDKFGEETIVWGSLLGLEKHHAPDRIGFRKTVGLDWPLT